MKFGLAFTAVTLLAPVAFAQAPPPPPPMAPDVVPSAPLVQSVLPNLFATTPGVTAELRADYSDIDGIDSAIFNALAHVQYLTPQGIGGYVRVPFGYVESQGDDDVGFSGSGIGNIEVGGLYVAQVGPQTEILARGAVAIDSASEEDGISILLSTILPRMVDAYASGLETTWGRGQVQLRHSIDNLRFGGAIGFDIPLAGDGADAQGFDGAINAVFAGGLQQGQLGIGVAFVLLRPITDDQGEGDDGDEFIKGLNVGADWAVDPKIRLFTQIGLSLEDNSDGVSIGLGTRAMF
jgi:Putative MetA-pathway of phenol degradation